jgi:hypothetical protein
MTSSSFSASSKFFPGLFPGLLRILETTAVVGVGVEETDRTLSLSTADLCPSFVGGGVPALILKSGDLMFREWSGPGLIFVVVTGVTTVLVTCPFLEKKWGLGVSAERLERELMDSFEWRVPGLWWWWWVGVFGRGRGELSADRIRLNGRLPC